MANKRSLFINQRGFTLIEILFSLSICLLIIFNTLPVVKLITYKDQMKVNSSAYAVGAKQIATILYTATSITLDDRLSFKNEKDEQFSISLHNHRVVKEPGFDIIIRDVEILKFYAKEKNIYMQLNDGKNDFHYLIAVDYQDAKETDEQQPSQQ